MGGGWITAYFSRPVSPGVLASCAHQGDVKRISIRPRCQFADFQAAGWRDRARQSRRPIPRQTKAAGSGRAGYASFGAKSRPQSAGSIQAGCPQANRRSFFARMRGLPLGNDSTNYPYPYRRHHDRAVTGLWLASLHDGKRGTCQVSQGASCLGRHQALLDIRGGTRAFATLTSCGSARAFATTRNRGSACAFPTTRNRGSAFLPTRNR
jgi:hypothetical protein